MPGDARRRSLFVAERPLGRPPHPRRPAGISNSDILTFTEADTQTLRVKILQKKFFRYAKTKFRVLLGVSLEPDEPYHASVDSGKVITVVR